MAETLTVEKTFLAFTKGEKEMDGRVFSKLCKDSKLFDKVFTPTDADLIFARVKPKGGRRIDIILLKKCLEAVAEKKKCTVESIEAKILEAGGPLYVGAKALPTKFHDDKSLYTGVHKHGGPRTVDTGRTGFGDLSEITDRSTATVRGVNTAVANETVAKPKPT